MTRENILIAVKTYPTLSRKYMELVCTAGFREDGSWIRIYPSPFRFLSEEQKYRKFQWVELDIQKNKRDKRPESYSPTNIDNIILGKYISTANHWFERKEFIFNNNRIYTNLSEIIKGAHNDDYSLVIFKPKEITKFLCEKVNDDWKPSKKQAVEESLKQGSLFGENDQEDLILMPKLPYKFSYQFIDDEGKKSKLMIEDWEIGQLYWNCLKKHGEEKALQKVKDKYMDDFAKTKDIHLFLGTIYEFHMRKSRNPYVIIGVFPLPIENQFRLL